MVASLSAAPAISISVGSSGASEIDGHHGSSGGRSASSASASTIHHQWLLALRPTRDLRQSHPPFRTCQRIRSQVNLQGFFFRPTPYGFRQVVQHVSNHVACEINFPIHAGAKLSGRKSTGEFARREPAAAVNCSR